MEQRRKKGGRPFSCNHRHGPWCYFCFYLAFAGKDYAERYFCLFCYFHFHNFLWPSKKKYSNVLEIFCLKGNLQI